MLPPTRSICLIAATRTGSNMLMSMFPRDRFANLGEVFNLSHFRKDAYRLLDEDLEEIRAKREADRAAFFKSHIHRKGLYGGRMPIWKYQYGNMSRPDKEPWQQEVIDAILAEDDVCFIHLTRRNLIARFVSQSKARITGEYVVPDHRDQQPADLAVTIKPKHFLNDVRRTRAQQAIADDLYGKTNRYLQVHYEDIVDDPEGMSKKISAAIGLDFELTPPRTLKQGKPLGEAIENYRQLRRALADTEWAQYLPVREGPNGKGSAMVKAERQAAAAAQAKVASEAKQKAPASASAAKSASPEA